MSTENPVFKVLVTKGNQAVLPIDQRPETLAVGQIGVFNYDTGLSISAASPVANGRNFFLAVGVDRNGDGVLDDIVTSAGFKIERDNITGLRDKCATGFLGKIVQISNITAKCEKEYMVKLSVSNEEGFLNYGPSLISKTFSYTTGCCADDCTTGNCDKGSCTELALGLATEINKDDDDIFVATLWDTTANAIVLFENVATWAAANPGECLAIRITTEQSAVARYCSINLAYFNPRGTNVEVALPEGFSCNGTITVIRDMVYSEGDGYDLQQLEYMEGGYYGNPGPYRDNGTGVGATIDYLAVKGTKYTTIDYTHRATVSMGWQTTKDNLRTTIAIPCADATTLAGLKAVLTPLVNTPAGLVFQTTTCTCPTDEVPPAEDEATDAELDAAGTHTEDVPVDPG